MLEDFNPYDNHSEDEPETQVDSDISPEKKGPAKLKKKPQETPSDEVELLKAKVLELEEIIAKSSSKPEKPLAKEGYEYIFVSSIGIDAQVERDQKFVEVNINGEKTRVPCDEQVEVLSSVAEVLKPLTLKQLGRPVNFALPQD